MCCQRCCGKRIEWTRNLAVQQGMQMPKVIARHLIQSFDVGEVTPEQAHEIGKQFADEWLKGKYEYVIATHIDKGIAIITSSSTPSTLWTIMPTEATGAPTGKCASSVTKSARSMGFL